MKFTFNLALASTVMMLSACSTLIPERVDIGDTEAALLAKRGEPTNRYTDGSYRLLEYHLGPWQQTKYMAKLDQAGKVISFEQVLTSEKFATIKEGQATKADVLKTIGAPVEKSFLHLSNLEVWSYPYKENGVWDSIMHVHFDTTGTVRKMMSGPDPRFDPDDRFGFFR